MAKGKGEMAQGAQPARKRGHALRNTGILIIFVIIIGGAYFYYEYLSGGILSLATAIASNPNAATSIILNKINSNPEFTLSYVGSATMNITTPQGDPVVTLPFNISYEKHQSDTRTTVSFSDFPVIGNFSSIVISEDNGSTVYVCYRGLSSGYTCAVGSGTAQQIERNLSNQFGLSNFGSASVHSVSPSYYDGLPCFLISGNGNLNGESILYTGSQNAALSFTGCFSSNYYVPLNITALITPAGGSPVTIVAHVVGISPTSSSNITTLPGPLINSST